MRAARTFHRLRRARVDTLGLSFVFAAALASCRSAPMPSALAARLDREERTGLYTWLVDHEPSTIVAVGIPEARLRELLPAAKVESPPFGANPCAFAKRSQAALVLVAAAPHAARDRAFALDCGIALFRDDVGFAIAPR